ncbi:MAG: hypothetical protein H8D38_06185 [DPANN group archaeon]|nr:hypothetical protein [DPANN group archaeon]
MERLFLKMSKIDYDELTNEEMEDIRVTFVPKKCPKCGELMVCRELGVWGYYCIDCMFWWGTYDPFPEVKGEPKKVKK